MPEEIKGLLEKIQKEGIQKAQEESLRVINEAGVRSAEIIAKARQEADLIIQKAKEEAEKMKGSTDSALKQAGRDFLISLRGEISALLKGIVREKVSQALTPQEMAGMIKLLIKEYAKGNSPDTIEALFSKEDLEKMKGVFLGKLSDEIKGGIVMKSCDDITSGFTISFDSGKSHFDFSDRSLAEYISSYLNKELTKAFNLE
ncbi:MAG: hypothetical protein WC293_02210 [Candidatus Omnitrophota bacterium]|jgi:V/A-type H+-transporting ATPase subunit E|nr:hypothetical protein [Candidatus Omnitrophota bacterium]MDD4981366.1 hypothetical protein [Candidatus Omnitrophota bacterium]MDD5664774.1 hypothetical protein [Candidatus Omnitrophota bacterium]